MDPQVRIRLIYKLLSGAAERGYDIGRTKLQKLSYFLKELGVDPGYRFNLRHYGPYSEQLASDLGILATLNAVNIEADPTGYGYHIHPKQPPEGDSVTELAAHEATLDYVLDHFGRLDARDLEVMATAQFVKRVLQNKEDHADRGEVINIVHALKPKYNLAFIDTCYERLESISLFEQSSQQRNISTHRRGSDSPLGERT